MLPKTIAGWAALIFVVLILMFGVAGAFAEAGTLVHEGIHGLQSFGNHARNG